MTMPADLDLAALDALFAAATPGEWKSRTMYSLSVIDAAGGTDTYSGTVWGSIAICETTEQTDGDGRTWSTGGTAEANAALIAALHNAWPSLKRRLEIGDAAVEVVDAKEAWRKAAATAEAFLDHPHFSARRYAELVMFRTDAKKAHDAARSRLRALREAPDAA